MRGRYGYTIIGADLEPAKQPWPIMPFVGLAAVGLAVIAVVRDERRAAREKW